MRRDRDEDAFFRIAPGQDIAEAPLGLDAYAELGGASHIGRDTGDGWRRRRCFAGGWPPLCRLSGERRNGSEQQHRRADAQCSHESSIRGCPAAREDGWVLQAPTRDFLVTYNKDPARARVAIHTSRN